MITQVLAEEIGGLLSKPPIRQNIFPAKISGHTVTCAQCSTYIVVYNRGSFLTLCSACDVIALTHYVLH